MESSRCLNPSDDEGESSSIKLLLKQVPQVDEEYVVQKLIGFGSFSNVFLASSKKNGSTEKFAIKHVFSGRISEELTYLKQIGGTGNVLSLLGSFETEIGAAIILPYFEHNSFVDYFRDMSLEEVRMYMKNLLLALERVHSFNVVHRDIKPKNFLYNRKERRYLLVDFGLSHNDERSRKRTLDERNNDFVKHKRVALDKALRGTDSFCNSNRDLNEIYSNIPTSDSTTSTSTTVVIKNTNIDSTVSSHSLSLVIQPWNLKGAAGTFGFRPPEVLLNYHTLTTAIDIWAAGIIMLILISYKYPFFRGGSIKKELDGLLSIFGSRRLKQIADILGCKLCIRQDYSPQDLRSLCQDVQRKVLKMTRKQSVTEKIYNKCGFDGKANSCSANEKIYPDSAYDLLRKLLTLNPNNRFSATEALQHSFFNESW